MALPAAVPEGLFCRAPPAVDPAVTASAIRLVQTALRFNMTAPSRLVVPAGPSWAARTELAARAGRRHHIAGRVPDRVRSRHRATCSTSYARPVRCPDGRRTPAADAVRPEFRVESPEP